MRDTVEAANTIHTNKRLPLGTSTVLTRRFLHEGPIDLYRCLCLLLWWSCLLHTRNYHTLHAGAVTAPCERTLPVWTLLEIIQAAQSILLVFSRNTLLGPPFPLYRAKAASMIFIRDPLATMVLGVSGSARSFVASNTHGAMSLCTKKNPHDNFHEMPMSCSLLWHALSSAQFSNNVCKP